jgi:hypothetical protein
MDNEKNRQTSTPADIGPVNVHAQKRQERRRPLL